MIRKFASQINFILIALMLLIHPVSADDELDDYVNNQHEKIFSFLSKIMGLVFQKKNTKMFLNHFIKLIKLEAKINQV